MQTTRPDMRPDMRLQGSAGLHPARGILLHAAAAHTQANALPHPPLPPPTHTHTPCFAPARVQVRAAVAHGVHAAGGGRGAGPAGRPAHGGGHRGDCGGGAAAARDRPRHQGVAECLCMCVCARACVCVCRLSRPPASPPHFTCPPCPFAQTKERARAALARKYRRSALDEESILRCLYSISDNNSYLLFNRDPIDRWVTGLALP